MGLSPLRASVIQPARLLIHQRDAGDLEGVVRKRRQELAAKIIEIIVLPARSLSKAR